MKPPHLNIQLLVDNEAVEFETQISIREEINAISSFTIGFGDSFNFRANRVRNGSIVQVYLSWGEIPSQLYLTGIVTREPKNISRGNVGVSASGSSLVIHADEKQAWDTSYAYLSYTNQKSSDIISNLLGFVPGISANIIPYSSEPRMSWECSHDSSIIDNVKSICEYSNYEWISLPDGSIRVRKPMESTEANASYMMLLGNISDCAGLPELPYIYIRNISIGNNDARVRNFYRVDGKDGVFGTGFNQFSINRVGRTVEGYHKDERLTSTQSCQIAARMLSEINGVSARPIDIDATGISEIRPGDVVYIASAQNRSDALPGYYRLLKKTANIGAVGWRGQYTFGRLQRNLTELFR